MLQKYHDGHFIKLSKDNNGIAPIIAGIIIFGIVVGAVTIGYVANRALVQPDQTTIIEGDVEDDSLFGGTGTPFDMTTILLLILGVFFIYMITRRR